MGKWLVILLLAFLGYAFVDSHALEIGNQSRDREGMSYYTPSRTTIHWDRYRNYLENIYYRTKRSVTNLIR